MRLTAEERAEWESLMGQSRVSAEKQLRARLLLKADEGECGPAWLDQQWSEALGVSRSKIMRLRRQFVGEGFQAVLLRRTSTQPRLRKLDGAQEARLIAVACSAPPEEARRLIDKLEIHYTPKHGSWLNMAETELGILSRQCLDRRIPDQEFLASEVAAWEESRNTAECKVIWQFTTDDARVKLHRLYPQIASVNSTKTVH